MIEQALHEVLLRDHVVEELLGPLDQPERQDLVKVPAKGRIEVPSLLLLHVWVGLLVERDQLVHQGEALKVVMLLSCVLLLFISLLAAWQLVEEARGDGPLIACQNLTRKEGQLEAALGTVGELRLEDDIVRHLQHLLRIHELEERLVAEAKLLEELRVKHHFHQGGRSRIANLIHLDIAIVAA